MWTYASHLFLRNWLLLQSYLLVYAIVIHGQSIRSLFIVLQGQLVRIALMGPACTWTVSRWCGRQVRQISIKGKSANKTIKLNFSFVLQCVTDLWWCYVDVGAKIRDAWIKIYPDKINLDKIYPDKTYSDKIFCPSIFCPVTLRLTSISSLTLVRAHTHAYRVRTQTQSYIRTCIYHTNECTAHVHMHMSTHMHTRACIWTSTTQIFDNPREYWRSFFT